MLNITRQKSTSWIFKACLAIFFCLIQASLPAKAASDTKTLLILNSYHEDELWGNSMMQPLISHVAHDERIDCEIMYLTNAIITDSTSYNNVVNNVFERFTDHHPDYLVLIGNFAFNLRDRIKSEWGNVPMLLISRTRGYGALDDYFATRKETVSIENPTPLETLRKDYNFTCIFVPDYCSQTVDMMGGLIPDMEELVFLSDASYVNRLAAYRLTTYLIDKYPKVRFRWVIASEANAPEFRNLMVTRNPRLGLLLSSWTYETMSTRGFPVLTSKDLSLISNAVNPVFTLRQAYLSYGTVGGVFIDNEKVKEEVIKVVDEMIAGKSMQDIPFYDQNDQIATINFTKLEKYGLSEKNCPPHTHFISKPKTYWEKYGVWTILILLSGAIIVSLLLKKNNEQRNKIEILNRHSHFINNMPVPYTCASIKMDEKNDITDITLYDRNQAFIDMLTNNTHTEDMDHINPSPLTTKKMQEMLATNRPVSFTYHFAATDKYYNMLICPVRTVKNDNGTHQIEIDAFARDITADEKMQMALKSTASKLDMTISIAKLIPWQMQWNTKTIEFDTTHEYVAEAIKHYKDESLKLSEYMTRVHPDDKHIMEQAIADVESGKISEYKIQYRIMHPSESGRIDWVENHGAVTQRDEDGKPEIVTGSIQFITTAKEKEEQMRVALVKANESDRLKSSFLAHMSHEIRTPLNAIVGFSSMMVRTKTEKEREDLSRVINKNNDLLLNLINDVLDLAKIESNTIELINNVCDVDDLLESVCKTMSIRVPKGVKLNIVHYTDGCKIEVDSSRLTQLLINLLTNACKFTKKGNITVGYEIIDDQKLYFFVKDTGIGIAKDKQEKIFDQFVKLDSFAQGTGLGLAICQSLVERMGGEIGVKSEGEGRGSMFWFTLPYDPVDIQELQEETSEDDDKPTEADEIHDFLMQDYDIEAEGGVRKHVLIAEDNESNYWLLQQMLRHRYNLSWARNGKEAVELCKKENPDIIIMDINMPVMDGYEAVAEIRKHSETVPVIAVTAYAFASDRIRILNSGFNAYVSKPISEIALFEAMHHVMTGHNEQP